MGSFNKLNSSLNTSNYQPCILVFFFNLLVLVIMSHGKWRLFNRKICRIVFLLYLFPRVLAIYTNHLGRNLVYEHKTIKFDSVGKWPAALYIQISWAGLKGWKYWFFSNCCPYYFSNVSQTEWREPFDFPSKISMLMVNTPNLTFISTCTFSISFRRIPS